MRLWIDGQCLQTASRMRGIGRYVTELLRAISEHHPDVELSISFNAAMADEAMRAREIVSGFVPAANIHVWHGALTGGEAVDGISHDRQLSEVALAHHINCLAPDVALSASPFEGLRDAAVPLLPSRGCRVPIAAIFYDAIPFRYAQTYLADGLSRDAYQRRLALHAQFDDNLCISEFSKSELEALYPNARAETISAGISKGFLAAEQAGRDASGDFGRFALYVGALDWRKNIRTLLKSFKAIDQAMPDNGLNLVLAGDGPQHLIEEILSTWAAAGLGSSRIHHLGHVSDEDLVALYRQARVVVQPSFMEGFGLTALEAIHCGTPVVAARAGALPEIVQSDELLFDPKSSDDLARAVVAVLRGEWRGDGSRMEQLQAHAARFTWQRTAGVAVERLGAIAQKQASPGVQALRLEILSTLAATSVDLETAARVLSLAEPVSPSKRLLVEVTSTVRVDHKTGIQRVVKNISTALAAQIGANQHFVSCDDDQGWFAVDGKTLARPDKTHEKPLLLGADTLLMLDSSWELHGLHSRYLRSCRLRGGEVISCLYDTIPLRRPAFCDPGMPPMFSEWFQEALGYSTGFVCISRAVADELYAILEGIAFPRPMKIGYWQLGADFVGGTAPVASHDRQASRPMFLMVGTLEPRKGYRVALDAFEQLWAEGVDAELVIVGKEGWGVEELAQRISMHPEHGHRLTWHATADDATLSNLYRTCDALLAASYAEGFGLPLVEAGHFGKPAIASDIPVFREVGVGARSAQFFEPGSASSLAHAVKGFLPRQPDAAETRPSAWPNWRGSAEQLKRVIVDGNWYKTYTPNKRGEVASLGGSGRQLMTAPLRPDQRMHRLELMEGPELVDRGQMLKITVAVTNLSNEVWSSRGSADGLLGVKLSHHILDQQGAPLEFINPSVTIPFVLIPGDTVYIAVMVPAAWKVSKAGSVDIELMQQGVGWFGSPLRVIL